MGRPRSVRAHDAVLEAAQALFAERGIAETSMDAVAQTSGVSKATIYKHWPDKDSLVLEVMAHLHGRQGVTPEIDTGSLREDIVAALSHEPPEALTTVRQRVMPHLIAYAARDQAFARLWRERVFDPPRQQLARILRRGIERGELPAELDVDLSIALLIGPLFYGHVSKLGRPDSPQPLRLLVVDAFLRGYGARPAGAKP